MKTASQRSPGRAVGKTCHAAPSIKRQTDKSWIDGLDSTTSLYVSSETSVKYLFSTLCQRTVMYHQQISGDENTG